MGNMSYCRFQNTLPDLRDCYEALDDFDGLSEDERKAAVRLVKLAAKIADEFGDVAEDAA